ncbi:unnamed protein product [Phaeothamnion confervicola]
MLTSPASAGAQVATIIAGGRSLESKVTTIVSQRNLRVSVLRQRRRTMVLCLCFHALKGARGYAALRPNIVAMTEGLAAAAGVPFRGFSRPPPRFRDKPFKYLQELEGRVESLTNLGDGVLRVDGWVVLVPLVAPGERVRVAIHSTYKNHSEATLLEVLERSLDRVEPECPLYGACGGCQYQHLSLEAQRRWKRQQVIDCLERIGGLKGVVVQPTAGTKHAYGYRSKITPHFDRPSPDGTVHAIGFRRTKFPSPFYGEQVATASAGIIDVPRCEIARPAINDALPAVRTAALEAMRRRARGVAAAFGGGGGSGSSNGGAENVTPAATTAQKLMGATLLLREVEEGVVTDHNAQVRNLSIPSFRWSAC